MSLSTIARGGTRLFQRAPIFANLAAARRAISRSTPSGSSSGGTNEKTISLDGGSDATKRKMLSTISSRIEHQAECRAEARFIRIETTGRHLFGDAPLLKVQWDANEIRRSSKLASPKYSIGLDQAHLVIDRKNLHVFGKIRLPPRKVSRPDPNMTY
jgi:hypothetical protein